MGPGEEANEGFKLFGSGVEKFSAAVAAFWTITDAFKDVEDKASENAKMEAKSTDEFKKATSEMKKTIKDDLKKAIDEQGGIVAKMFGSGGMFSGGFVAGLKAILPLLRSFLIRFIAVAAPLMLLSKFFQAIIDALGEQLNESRNIRKQLGLSFDPNRFLDLRAEADATDLAAATPIGAKKTAEIVTNLNTELKNANAITGDMIAGVAVLEKGLGVDLASSAEFFGTALRNTEATTQDLTDTFSQASIVADEMGFNVSDFVNELASAPELAQQFALETRKGQMELVRSAATAKAMGKSMQEMRDFGDQFFDLATAAESAATLRNFGVDMSSQELLVKGMENPVQLAQDIVSQLDTDMSRMEQLAFLQANPQMSQLFGSPEALQKAIAAAGDPDKIAKIVEQAGKSSQEKLNDNLSEYVTATKTVGEAIDDAFEKLGNTIATLISPDFLPKLIDKMVEMIAVMGRLPIIIAQILNKLPFVDIDIAGMQAEQAGNQYAQSMSRMNAAQRFVAGSEEGNQLESDLINSVMPSGALHPSAVRDRLGIFDDEKTSIDEIRKIIYDRAKEAGLDTEDGATRTGLNRQVERLMETLVTTAKSNDEFIIKTVDGRRLITLQADDKGTEGQ